MGFWSKLFQGDDSEPPPPAPVEEAPSPRVRDENIPHTLDLGWYYSEDKNELQMAKVADKDRATHCYIIGATGTGKTKFLQFLIQQDIEKGNGFAVIDPHGDLIEDLKGFLAARCYYTGGEQEIREQIILIDPTDPKFTVTFNPLEALPGVSVPEQANELISSFRKIWADSWGVRMEDLLRNSLIALGEAELTLLELPPFLTRRSFRETVLQKVSHPVAREYFQRFDTMTDRSQITWIEPVMNKINAFLSDPRLRTMFASPKSSFNLREAMDQKKGLLIKLDKGKLKDAADLLGSLLMAKIQLAAFSRSNIRREKRVPFYLYIDEFQNFASESFEVILSEARKYGLSLIMAHQTLAQISEELKSLILGNAGLQVFFRVNRKDASLLAKEIFAYSGYEVKTVTSLNPKYWSFAEEWEHKTEELQNLSPRFCYAKHKVAGGVLSLYTFEMEPPWEIVDLKAAEFLEFQQNLPFGQKYLVAREELSALEETRQALIPEAVRARPVKERETKRREIKVAEKPAKEAVPEERVPIPPPVAVSEKAKVSLLKPKTESQHRYLQTLIKKMAEEKGFKAVIEQPTPDGQGMIDVSLEQNGKKIAVEISVTTTPDHEVGNIRKGLLAGYEKVVVCSSEKKILDKIQGQVSKALLAPDLERVLFFQPEGLLYFLEAEAAKGAGKEQRVKGYKVKVQYQPVREADKQVKREAVAKVIIGALKRMEGK
jgi:hypothetical protein